MSKSSYLVSFDQASLSRMAKSKEYWQDLSKLPTIPEELETFDDTRSRSVAFNEEVVMPTAKFCQETKQNQETFRH